jgi:hypothetical protein
MHRPRFRESGLLALLILRVQLTRTGLYLTFASREKFTSARLFLVFSSFSSSLVIVIPDANVIAPIAAYASSDK